MFTETAIQEAGITRPEDFLSLVPNVNFVTSNHEGEFFVNVRGQASVRFAESAVAVVIDGVRLATSNEFNQDFFDIEQIEVLKRSPKRALRSQRDHWRHHRQYEASWRRVERRRPSNHGQLEHNETHGRRGRPHH